MVNPVANIFLSHKSEDQRMALGLRELLQKYDKDERIHIHLSKEIVGGDQWYKWIRTKLNESSLLLLLYTDPKRTWDWCLYEAGLFDRLDDSFHRRIVCLHSTATAPPAPLGHLQSFSAAPDRMAEFLRQFLTETELLNLEAPVADWLLQVPQEFEKLRSEICQLVDRAAQKTKYFSKYMFIRVTDVDRLKQGEIPPDSRIISSEASLDIFRKDFDENLTWADLVPKARENDDIRWVSELTNAMSSVANGDLPRPIQAGFQSLGEERTHRPHLYRADKLADGSCEFKILFPEDVTWRLKDVPRHVGSLLTVLVMATRFKYEVVNKFLDPEGRLVSRTRETSEGILRSILDIETESRSRGHTDQLDLAKLFELDEEQREIQTMFGRWEVIRADIHHLLLLEEPGEAEFSSLEEHLQELAGYTKRFLSLGLACYGRLVEVERCGARSV